MKLIKKINRVNEAVDIVADLDQENVVEKDPEVEANIKETEQKAKEDEKEIKKINGKQPEQPKPITEDMEEAQRIANEIRANAEAEVAEVMATATAEEMAKQAELDELAKQNLLSDVLSNLTSSIWSIVDSYQNAISTIKANNLADNDICDIIEEIISQEYIHVGEIQGLIKDHLGDAFTEKSNEGEAEVATDIILDGEDAEEVQDFDLEVDEEPEPIEVGDLDDFHADLEIEDEVINDGEPAAIDVVDLDLE